MYKGRRFLILLTIMVVLTLTVGSIAIMTLYQVAFSQQRERLIETAKSQARLMEAVARFNNRNHNPDDPSSAKDKTLSQIIDARTHFRGFGDTGEFTLGERDGDSIKFLIAHRHSDLDNPKPVPFDSKLAEPMRQALLGHSGSLIGLDYRGETVLAAYEPVSELDYGIVAKIDLSEIRKPFIRAAMLTGGVALVLIAIGIFLFLKISNPILAMLEGKKNELEDLVHRRTMALKETNRSLEDEVQKRKKALEEIRKYERIFSASTESIVMVDRDNICQAVTGSFLMTYQKSRDQIIGQHLANLVGQETFDSKLKHHIDRSLAGEQIKTQDWFDIGGHNRRFMDMVYYPYLDENSDITGLVIDSRDMTERKLIEEELKKKETILTEMEKMAKIGAWEYDLVNNSLFWSDEVFRIFEKDPDRFNPSYDVFLEYTHPDDRAMVDEQFKEAIKTKSIYDVEHRLVMADGTIKVVSEKCITQYNEKDEPVRSLGAVQDITHRRKVEEELRQSNKRLLNEIIERKKIEAEQKNIFELPKTLILLTSPNSTIIRASAGWQEAFGYSIFELVGRSIFDLIHPMDMAESRFEIMNGIKAKAVRYFENRFKKKDGTYRTLAWSLSTDPNTYQNCFVAQDITEHKSLEEQLRQSQKMEAIGTLAGGIAHDFNTLISTIIGYTDVISKELPESSHLHDDLGAIAKVANRAQKLVKQIKEFSRPKDATRQPVDIVSLVRNSVDFIKTLLPTSIKVVETYRINEQLINANVDQINQVLINLCSNAGDFMNEEKGIIRVSLEKVKIKDHSEQYPGLRFGNYVKLSISDNGRGIEPEIMARIFDPYFTTKEFGKGSGMGLSVVHSIITSHTGNIFVQSRINEGTTFDIFLPAVVQLTIQPENGNGEDGENLNN